MKQRQDLLSPHQFDALEARLAARMTAALSERASALPHDISERLRIARDQAVSRAREARAPVVATQASVSGNGGRAASLVAGGPSPWWLRLATFAPLVVLAAGLLLIVHWTDRQQVLAAAEIDAVLLADDLPPTAYSDPGFREFLKAPPP